MFESGFPAKVQSHHEQGKDNSARFVYCTVKVVDVLLSSPHGCLNKNKSHHPFWATYNVNDLTLVLVPNFVFGALRFGVSLSVTGTGRRWVTL